MEDCGVLQGSIVGPLVFRQPLVFPELEQQMYETHIGYVAFAHGTHKTDISWQSTQLWKRSNFRLALRVIPYT